MFICENPGYKELQLGQPLVGPAGKQFDMMLEAAGLSRRGVYLANMTCCTDLTRENRHPLPDELTACQPRLLAEIAKVDPVVIVAMGNVAYTLFFPGYERAVGKARHHIRSWQGRLVVGTYHPASTLANRYPELFPLIVEDMRLAVQLVKESNNG